MQQSIKKEIGDDSAGLRRHLAAVCVECALSAHGDSHGLGSGSAEAREQMAGSAGSAAPDTGQISRAVMVLDNNPYELNTLHAPFLLSPAGKDYLWGGHRLKDDFSKEFDLDPLAETWECSTHPDGASVVRSGPFAGRLLPDVLREHPDFIGTHPRMSGQAAGDVLQENAVRPAAEAAPQGVERTADGQTAAALRGKEREAGAGLPILVKFIDAGQDLSVQVHPTDEYAAEHENGSLGKTEMWYVVEAAKGARLVYGFRHDMTREELLRALETGTLGRHLQFVPVQKGDVFFIPSGQVHAIGAGCLVAEVQESSNVTYRLYDYNRVDKAGKKRELHIAKALDVVNYRGSAQPRQPMKEIRFRKGLMIESLCHCKYFQVEKVTVDTQRCRELAWFKTRANSFRVLLCLEGCGVLDWGGERPAQECHAAAGQDTSAGGGLPADRQNAAGGDLPCAEAFGERFNFFRGDCIFVPADSVDYSIHGHAVLLRVSC